MFHRVFVCVLLMSMTVALLSAEKAPTTESTTRSTVGAWKIPRDLPVESAERDPAEVASGTAPATTPNSIDAVTSEKSGALMGLCSSAVQKRVRGQMWRNASGHWTATAHMEQSAHAHAQPVALEAETSLRRCGGLGVMALTLTMKGERMNPSPGYKETRYVGSYYKVHKELFTWDEAKTTCEEENAHLLVINSEEEASAIKQLLGEYPDITGWIAIGFSDRKTEGEYLTILGETLDEAGYTKWKKGQPSKTVNADGKIKQENCGSISSENISLNDITCSLHIYPFICEQST